MNCLTTGARMESQAQEGNWLQRMHTLITWKFVHPEINNPFKPQMTDKVLNELATQIDILKKHCKVRFLLDGEEFASIGDLSTLNLTTDHPILKKMPKPEVRKYLEENGLLAKFNEELAATQVAFKEELARRKSQKK